MVPRLAVAGHHRPEGYVFQYPNEVFPGPSPDAADAISRIEQEAGKMPLALKLFWLRVGSVNLCGAHPHWLGCDYPDPLVVSPPAHALPDLEASYRVRIQHILRSPDELPDDLPDESPDESRDKRIHTVDLIGMSKTEIEFELQKLRPS